MNLIVQCQGCGKNMTVPESYAGRRVKCPNCAAVIQIPGPMVAKVVQASAPDPLADLPDELQAAGRTLPKAVLPKPAPRPMPLAARPARPRRRYEGAASAETLLQFVAFVVGVSLLLALVLCKLSPGWAAFVIGLSVLFAMAVSFGAVVWAWVVAAQESVLCLLGMFVPLFNLFWMAFYTITRWDRMKGPFLFWLLAQGHFVGIVLIASFFGPEGRAVMPWSAAPSQVTAESDPGAAPTEDRRKYIMAMSTPAVPTTEPARQQGLPFLPESSVTWSVKPDPPTKPAGSSEPTEPPGKFFDSPIPIGTPTFVRDRAYGAPASGRVAVLHLRETSSWVTDDDPGFPRAGRRIHSGRRFEKRYDSWLTWHDLAKGRLIERLSLDFGARLLALNPRGDVALLRPEPDDGRLIGWSLRDNKSTFEFRRWRGEADATRRPNPLAHSKAWGAFTDDEHVMIYEGSGLSYWRLPQGEAAYNLRISTLADVCLSPGRHYVAVCDRDKVQFLDVATGSVKGELLPPQDTPARSGEKPSLAAHVAVGLGTSHGRAESQRSAGVRGTFSQVAFSPDGKRFAASGEFRGKGVLCCWDLASGSPMGTISLGDDRGKPCWCDADRLLVRRHGEPDVTVPDDMRPPQGPDGVARDTALLVDVDRRTVVWRYDLENAGPFEFCRDGRLWMLFRSEKRRMDYLAPMPPVRNEVLAKLKESLPPGGRPAVGPGARLSLKVSFSNVSDLGPGLAAEVERWQRAELVSGRAKVLPDEPIALVVRCEPGPTETIVYGVGGYQFISSRHPTPERSFSETVTPYRCSLALVDGERVLWAESMTAGGALSQGIFLPEGQDAVTLVRQRVLQGQKEAVRDFFLYGTSLPKQLHCELRDAEGKLGLGSTPMDMLEEVVVPGNQDLTGLVDAEHLNPQQAPSGEGYEQSSRDYVQAVMVDVLCGEDDALRERLRWFPKAKRPAIGLRWAFGIELVGEKTTAEIEDAWDVRRITGEIGPFLGREIEDRIAKGDFGEWPDRGDPRFRQVVILGIAPRDKLLDSARRQAVDVLIVANLTTKIIGLRRNETTTMRFQFFDVSTNGLLWTSPALKNTRQSRSADEVAAEVLEQIDSDFRLAAMPAMRPEHAEGRLKTLAAAIDQSDSPGKDRRLALLAVMIELRYYQLKDLITADQATALCDKILGDGNGKTLATGDEDQRREALRAWLQPQEGKADRE